MIEHFEGDLFATAVRMQLDAIGHGVNCVGVMGAGIAVEFKRIYPDMFAAYSRECRAGALTPGGVFPWENKRGRWIYNLATQNKPGRDARLEAVESSVRKMAEHALANGVSSIGLPRIASGIGGLLWNDVEQHIADGIEGSGLRIVVCTPPGQAKKFATTSGVRS